MAGRARKHNLNGEFQELYDQGISDYRIARMLGCNEGIVWKWRKKNNLPCHNLPRQPKPKADLSQHFNFREFTTMLDKAVEDAGVPIHTLEGRKCRDGLFNKYEGVFLMDWRTT